MIPRRSPNLLPQPRARQRRWVLTLVALLGVAMSSISGVYLRQRQEEMLASEFKIDVQDRVTSIQREMEERVLRLGGLAGLFAASQKVEPQEFDRYIDEVFGPQDRAGLITVGWAEHVTHAQRASFEARMSQTLGQAVFIADLGNGESLVPSPNQDEYYPLVHDHLIDRNKVPWSIGLDQIRDEPRRRAMRESLQRREARIVITPRIRRLPAVMPSQGVVLLFVPWHMGDQGPPTIASDAPRGVVSAVLHLPSIVSHAVSYLDPLGINLQLDDVTQAAPLTLVRYRSRLVGEHGETFAETSLKHSAEFNIAGRQLRVTGTALQPYIEARTSNMPAVAFFWGLMVTALLLAYLHRILSHTSEVEALVEHRTLELKQTNADLQQEITQRGKMEAALRTVAAGVSGDVGEDFLRSLVRQLAAVLNMRYAFLSTTQGMPPGRVRLLVLWDKDHFAPTFAYDIAGTPCEHVIERQLAHFPREVGKRFPDDRWLQEAGIDAYIAIPLFDSHGKGLGHLGAMDGPSAQPRQPAEPLLRVFAARAAAELERMIAEQELHRTADALHRSNTELQQFAYIASHDLQEPLRMISSYCQLLERRYHEVLDDEGRQFISFAVDGARRLQAMIHDLLMYSRVQTQAAPLKPVSMETVLEHAMSHLRLQMAETDASITHDPLPEVLGDQGQLVTLMQNLLSNAMKFRQPNEPPKVHVGVRPADGSAEHALLTFCVQDNGIGIDPAHRDKIFDIFRRLHSRERYEGTGIGLAVAKRVVERHGGRIWVEPAPSHGSIFLFTLPPVPASPEPPIHTPA